MCKRIFPPKLVLSLDVAIAFVGYAVDTATLVMSPQQVLTHV